jgi:perosamine synthetase
MKQQPPVIRWWRTDLGAKEAAAISKAVLSRNISQGSITTEFERRLGEVLEISHVVAVSSGSAALVVALMALGIKVGDQVLVPRRSWIATAHAVSLIGAVPLFVDVEPDRPIMKISSFRKLLTKKTKAVIPVHLNGRSADMEAILEVAQENNISVVEDAAQAMYSRNQKGYLGTQSDIGCFSLSVAKLISTGQGGVLVTREDSTAKKIRAVRTHGLEDVQDVACWGRMPGFNFRITDMQSAIGLVQLEQIAERANRVRQIYQHYEEGLKDIRGINVIPVDLKAGEIPIYNEVLCDKRAQFMAAMQGYGIETRRFFPDMAKAPYFEDTIGGDGASQHFGLDGVTLPSGPDQSLEDVEYVVDKIRKISKEMF